jgi:N utilization substance protein B
MATRTQVRTAVVQMLYAIDLGNNDMEKQSVSYLDERKIKGLKAEFGIDLFEGVLENLEKIDETIKNHLSKEWDFDRLDKVDKAILRLGVYEELFTDLPYQVVINESVEIAKLLSSENSTRFVNGMLDKIAKEKDETVHSS